MGRLGRLSWATAAAALLFLLAPALAGDQGALAATALTGIALPGGFNFQSSLGACGFPAAAAAAASTPSWAGLAALSPTSTLALQTSPLSGCGICLQVSSAAASAVVQVTDTCASCSASQLAVDADTFRRLSADSSAGLIPVSYSIVECTPPGNATVSVDIYRAGDGGYLRLAVFNLAGSSGIAELELRQTPLVGGRLDIVASSWRRMLNAHGAQWELSGFPTPPLDLRVTDGAGRQLLLRKVITEEGKTGTFRSTAQFPRSESPAGIAASATAALAQPPPAAALLAPPTEDVQSAAPEEDIAAGSGGFGAAGGAGDGTAAAATPPSPTLQAPAAAANASCKDTVLAVLSQHPSLTALVALIRTAGVEAAYQSDVAGLSVFAPSNDALALAVQSFPLLRYDAAALQAVLLQHLIVVPLHDFSTQFVTYDTLGGSQLRIRRTETSTGGSRLMIISDASAATAPLHSTQACGSSVRLCDSVLLPAQLGRRRRR